MIIQLLLLSAAFAGAWLMMQPTEQFTYARRTEALEQETVRPMLRNLAGLIICLAALSLIFVTQS